MDGKTKALVAHITLIGWVIALIVNSNNKDEIASFYIRQVLGIFLFSVIVMWVPIVNLVGGILGIVMWIMSIIGAASGEEKELPIVGAYFQEWFKGI